MNGEWDQWGDASDGKRGIVRHIGNPEWRPPELDSVHHRVLYLEQRCGLESRALCRDLEICKNYTRIGQEEHVREWSGLLE